MTPLRQLKVVPSEIVRKAEGKQFVRFWSTLLEYGADITILVLVPILRPGMSFSLVNLAMLMVAKNPPEIGKLLGILNAGRFVHRLIHNFPKLQ
jgi:nucleoside-diphosphate-sugar epimerase